MTCGSEDGIDKGRVALGMWWLTEGGWQRCHTWVGGGRAARLAGVAQGDKERGGTKREADKSSSHNPQPSVLTGWPHRRTGPLAAVPPPPSPPHLYALGWAPPALQSAATRPSMLQYVSLSRPCTASRVGM